MKGTTFRAVLYDFSSRHFSRKKAPKKKPQAEACGRPPFYDPSLVIVLLEEDVVFIDDIDHAAASINQALRRVHIR